MSIFSRFFGGGDVDKLKRRLRGQIRRFAAMGSGGIAAGRPSRWGGVQTTNGDDSLNKEYLSNLAQLQSRAQDLDVNNPDVHGFHRTRVAQVIGDGVTFKHTPHAGEVSMSHDTLATLTEQINRIRELHSKRGGFDAQGLGRTEGKQQERALLTAFVLGSCLIHRVWNSDNDAILPFSIELIPGSRISTPFKRMGDPKINYGVEYTDEHRTRVVGWHVRKVSKTVGNQLVPDYDWDFIPVADGSLLSLTEVAGIDCALPLSTSVIRMIRNRGEFIESAVENARAQSRYYGVTKCAPDSSPWDLAGDDATETRWGSNGAPQAFVDLGGGVSMLYAQNNEEVEWNSAKLPDPDFTGFMAVTDDRCARGFVSSISRFTRKVNNSWSGGRLEDQQDDPIVDQYRGSFVAAWHKVNEWFLESVWLSSVVKLPNYTVLTKHLWSEFRAEFPGKLHINPVDTAKARSVGFGLRTLTPQQACEEDGKDLLGNLRQWAQAEQLARQVEKEFGLEEGALEFLMDSRIVSTSGGEEVATQQQDATVKGDDGKEATKARLRRLFLNRIKESVHG